MNQMNDDGEMIDSNQIIIRSSIDNDQLYINLKQARLVAPVLEDWFEIKAHDPVFQKIETKNEILSFPFPLRIIRLAISLTLINSNRFFPYFNEGTWYGDLLQINKVDREIFKDIKINDICLLLKASLYLNNTSVQRLCCAWIKKELIQCSSRGLKKLLNVVEKDEILIRDEYFKICENYGMIFTTETNQAYYKDSGGNFLNESYPIDIHTQSRGNLHDFSTQSGIRCLENCETTIVLYEMNRRNLLRRRKDSSPPCTDLTLSNFPGYL